MAIDYYLQKGHVCCRDVVLHSSRRLVACHAAHQGLQGHHHRPSSSVFLSHNNKIGRRINNAVSPHRVPSYAEHEDSGR